jgi:ATP-dependent Clp protease adaptor protein ClpS
MGMIEMSETESKPNLFKVVFLNDDYTPMQFVTSVLEEIFHQPPEEAFQTMITTHRLGRYAVAALDEAQAKAVVKLIDDRARAAKHPFKCVLEAA